MAHPSLGLLDEPGRATCPRHQHIFYAGKRPQTGGDLGGILFDTQDMNVGPGIDGVAGRKTLLAPHADSLHHVEAGWHPVM